jgi:hypothetical protein
MGLGLNLGGGDTGPITQHIKYDARAGRIFRVDREDGVSDQVDITHEFKAIFDLENVEVGYIKFETGQAPDFNMVPLGSPMPARASPEHKQGVRLLVKLSAAHGGDVRELSSTAMSFLGKISELHDKYEEGVAANPGKLPVVAMTGSETIKTQKSTNYAPIFKISGWASRPADLPSKSTSVLVKAAPPSTGSTKVSAPVAVEEDFG